MYKLTDPVELEKAGHSLASFFAKRAADLEKTHAHHAALGVHHDAMSKAHATYATQTKAVHAGLSDDHELKAHLAQKVAHHEAMSIHHGEIAKAHAAHAETMKTELDSMKSMSAEWGGTAKAAGAGGGAAAIVAVPGEPGSGIAGMITETTTLLTKKALESLDSDPVVQDKIREMVLKGVAAALGDKIVPDNIRGVITEWPGATIQPVPRHGQPTAKTAPVAVEFEHLVKIDD